MITEKHKKHPPISRPKWGKFGRNEIGVLGAPCGVIENWVNQVTKDLTSDSRVIYFDADHQGSDAPQFARLTDQVSHHVQSSSTHLNDYDLKLRLRDYDLAIVNSNHFLSNRQIVFCTEKKKDSLFRKLVRLTQVELIILDKDISEPFDFLTPYMSNSIKVIGIEDYNAGRQYIDSIVHPFESVKGLVLAGGRSTRMGRDKGQLDYHGQSQVKHLINTFSNIGLNAHVSCRQDQSDQYGEISLPDSFLNMGPYGAILSAFKKEPDTAWFACACDIPLLSELHLNKLLKNRNLSKVATCFYNPETKWPEPLITLWEPRAYARMLDFMTLGYNCPRKVLINSDIEMIRMDDNSFMDNANTPEDFDRIKATI